MSILIMGAALRPPAPIRAEPSVAFTRAMS